MNFLNIGLIFTPEIFILCQEVSMPSKRGSRAGDSEFFIYKAKMTVVGEFNKQVKKG